MKSAVLMLYGPHGQHPWREDMFMRPDRIQRDLKKRGFGFDVAMVAEAPSGEDRLPDVRIAENPVYDQVTGDLLEAHFKPGTIEDYPSIIDHWVANFQDEVLQPNGTYQRTAYGIGLPAKRLWNHKHIQAFGNHKDKMDELIQGHGVGIETYSVLDYEKFVIDHGSMRELIYKPQGGSLGKGIRVFSTIAEFQQALEAGHLAKNGFIQPYLSTTNPIKGLVGANVEQEALLAKFNGEPDRPREIRMHVIATTDAHGNIVAEAYPTLKVSESDQKFLKRLLYIGLDPECLGAGTFMHDKSVELAIAVCQAADAPQYYGVFDWLVDGDARNPEDIRVVDGNCRGPHLPVVAEAAREAFLGALVLNGKKFL